MYELKRKSTKPKKYITQIRRVVKKIICLGEQEDKFDKKKARNMVQPRQRERFKKIAIFSMPFF